MDNKTDSCFFFLIAVSHMHIRGWPSVSAATVLSLLLFVHIESIHYHCSCSCSMLGIPLYAKLDVPWFFFISDLMLTCAHQGWLKFNLRQLSSLLFVDVVNIYWRLHTYLIAEVCFANEVLLHTARTVIFLKPVSSYVFACCHSVITAPPNLILAHMNKRGVHATF